MAQQPQQEMQQMAYGQPPNQQYANQDQNMMMQQQQLTQQQMAYNMQNQAQY